MKPPQMPPNIVIRMGTFPPKPTTGWCWQHGRYLIGRKRLTTDCPSCLIIEMGTTVGKVFRQLSEAIQEFGRSMERLAKVINESQSGQP